MAEMEHSKSQMVPESLLLTLWNNLDLQNAPFRVGLQGRITYDMYSRHITFKEIKNFFRGMIYKDIGKKMKLSVGSVNSLIKGEGIVSETEENE